VPEFGDANCYASWAVDPLLVASHPAKFGGCQMSATLLATDQVCLVDAAGAETLLESPLHEWCGGGN
jgi:hypothetical protein